MNKKSFTLSSLLLVLTLSLVACGGQEPPASEPPKTTQAAPAPSEPATAGDTASSSSADTATEQTESADTGGASEPTQAETAETEAKTEEVALAADAGQKRYEATCKMCHAQGLLDAPKLNDKANWETRIKQGKETLYTHSIKGFNKMPAQAVGDVSEAEVKAAVDYMLSQAGVS